MPLARSVTPQESAFYVEHGWVVLRHWIDPAVAAEMLVAARAAMGEMADRPPKSPLQDDPRVWRRWDEPWRTHPSFERFAQSSEFREPLVALSKLRSGLRYIDDQIVVKLPASAGTMGETPWHQDHPCLPIDRAGDLTAWVALHEMEPEHGTLRFLDRSHHEGPLAVVSLQLDLRETHPSVFAKYPASDPLHLRAGDATVHHGCTVHGAPPNETASPRWAYIAEFIPGDARIAGRRSARVEAAGLAAGDGFDHPAFPLNQMGLLADVEIGLMTQVQRRVGRSAHPVLLSAADCRRPRTGNYIDWKARTRRSTCLVDDLNKCRIVHRWDW